MVSVQISANFQFAKLLEIMQVLYLMFLPLPDVKNMSYLDS